MNVFDNFATRFNKSKDSKPSTQVEIDELEKNFNLHLPKDYKAFLQSIGNIWTPGILDLIVDKELDLNDVQQFWTLAEIIEDKKNGWTKKVLPDILPFASDCMGNIFSFLIKDLSHESDTSGIYFFDHDFDTVEKISNSFTDWLDGFNKL